MGKRTVDECSKPTQQRHKLFLTRSRFKRWSSIRDKDGKIVDYKFNLITDKISSHTKKKSKKVEQEEEVESEVVNEDDEYEAEDVYEGLNNQTPDVFEKFVEGTLIETLESEVDEYAHVAA
jgi:hypothetical protein